MARNEIISEPFLELMQSRHQLIVAYGGRGSGKTYHICLKLLTALTGRGYVKIVFCRKYKEHIRESTWEYLKNVAKEVGIYHLFEWKDHAMNVICKETGNKAFCKGLDDPEKTKGIADPTIIWVDEINECNEADITSLMALLRSPKAEYLQFIGSFNPVSETHWLRKFFFTETDPYALKPEFNGLAHHSTYLDNDFIDKQAYYNLLINNANGSQYRIDVDVYGRWGNIRSDKLFLHAFDKDKHVPVEPIALLPGIVYVSVDFNVNPMTAIVAQHDIHYRYIHIIKEYRLENSDVYALCDRLKRDFDHKRMVICGDQSGHNRSAANRGNKSMYEIIKQELRIAPSQIKAGRGKPNNYVQTKRNLANALFARHPGFKVSSVCQFLIEDMMTVDVTADGKIDKHSDPTKSHLIDCLCDYLFTLCQDAVKRIPSLRK